MHAQRRCLRAVPTMVLWLALWLTVGGACARTLEVGPSALFRLPSVAAAAATAGDTIRIAPGRYVDCMVLHQDRLTVEGTGPGVVLADLPCAGKALLVVDGNDVTVRGLVLQHARVADRNGAGIRAEGGSLTVEASQFVDDENGILAADNPAASIRVIDSTFVADGRCAAACAHAIYAGAIALLHVAHSRFVATREGHSIKSRALRTEVIDCDIQDGWDGTSSYLVEAPNGGSLVVEGSRLEKGPHTRNAGTAIMIGSEGVIRPISTLVVRDNRFVNDAGRRTVFVRNLSEASAMLGGNVLVGPVEALVGPGVVR